MLDLGEIFVTFPALENIQIRVGTTLVPVVLFKCTHCHCLSAHCANITTLNHYMAQIVTVLKLAVELLTLPLLA